jgi:hypothetical protein
VRREGKVIVALSGPGHSTGLTEHLSLVDCIVSAAAKETGIRWLLRAHRKDNPETYRRAARRHQVGNVEIEWARSAAKNLEDELDHALALVTTNSTSAADAMLKGVPVVTLARPTGEPVPDFVTRKATIHIEPSAIALVSAIREVRSAGVPPDVTIEARRYADDFFGLRDGNQGVRVAQEIAHLASRWNRQ